MVCSFSSFMQPNTQDVWATLLFFAVVVQIIMWKRVGETLDAWQTGVYFLCSVVPPVISTASLLSRTLWLSTTLCTLLMWTQPVWLCIKSGLSVSVPHNKNMLLALINVISRTQQALPKANQQKSSPEVVLSLFPFSFPPPNTTTQ